MTSRPMLSLAVAAALALPIGLGAGGAPAAQNPRGLLAGVERAKGCTIETKPLAFGSYDPLAGTAVDGVGEVIYTCGTKGAAASAVKNIRIEISRGLSNSYDRQMRSADDRLSYNIYLDADHRTVWGDGSSGTDYYFNARPPNKTPVTVPAYGRIFPEQDVAVGQYSDVLQVKIYF